MRAGPIDGVLHHLRRVALRSDDRERTDAQLLECFLNRRDESAFAVLVRRHGPMVSGVCRRVLGNTHDAEDAFQATFLVLVRKAASIARRELLGNWLFGTAYRAALEVKTARRRRKERQASEMPEPEAAGNEAAIWRDLRPLLDRELSRLPDKYRVPIVLCDLEGGTRREVARRLGIPEGTLSGRLTTAHRMLARRLAQHGVTLSCGVLATILSQGSVSACLPSPLVSSTVKTATGITAGQAGSIPAEIAALAEGVMKTMLLTKLKTVTLVLLLLTFAGVGAMGLAQPRPPAEAAEADKQANRPVPPAKVVVRFPNAPGCFWMIEPTDLPGLMATLGIVFIYEKDRDGAAFITLASALPDDRVPEYRPVLLDAAGKRYLPETTGPGGYSGGAGGVITSLSRWRMDPKVLPAEKVSRIGIEALTPEYHRIAARAALERARKEGIEVLPCPEAGKPFDFVLTTTDGKKLRARDLRGKVVLIDCWATWCSPCMALIPELKELYEKVHKDGLEIIGVNFDRDAAKLKKTCAKLALPWPQVIVPSEEKTRQLWEEITGVGCLPRLFLIDREGVLRADSPSKLQEEVARLLKETSEKKK